MARKCKIATQKPFYRKECQHILKCPTKYDKKTLLSLIFKLFANVFDKIPRKVTFFSLSDMKAPIIFGKK